MDYLLQLQNKPVTVIYRGMTYRGTLVSAGKEGVTLEMFSGRIILPMLDITSIRPFPGRKDH